jgi:hypothetical protein
MPKVQPPELKKFMDKKLSSAHMFVACGWLAAGQPAPSQQQHHPDLPLS